MYSMGPEAGKRAVTNFESFGTGATDRTGSPFLGDHGDRRSMHRTRNAEALLIGLLAALATFCALEAGAAETHSIVAQSDGTTAGTGRRPLSQRIAAAALPIQVDSRSQPRDADPPGAETPLAAAEPLAGTAAERQASAAIETAAAAPRVAAKPVVAPPVAEFGADTPPAEPLAETDEPLDPAGEEPLEQPLEEQAPVDQQAAGQPYEEEPAALQPSPLQPSGDLRHAASGDAPRGAGADASPPDDGGAEAPALVTQPDEILPTEEAAPPAGGIRGMLLRRVKVALAGIPRPIDPRPLRARAIPPRELDAGTTAADPSGSKTDPAAAEPVGEDVARAPARPAPAALPAPAGTPARLEFDVCESRTIVGEGEQLVMRIDVRNVGGVPAEGVTATLFFAEGVEPVQSIGHSAQVYPGEVRFAAVDTLAPGNALHLLVTAVGTKPGSVTYRGELECRQLAGRLAREGAVTVSPRQAAAPQAGPVVR
jgi:hypothetical protein